MANAVREGSRLGATLEESDDWAAAVQSRVVALSSGDLESGDVCVKLIKKLTATTEDVRQETSCSDTLAGAEPSTDDVPVDHCAVKVWAGRTSGFNVVFFSRDLDLRAAAINRYERAGESEECGS